MIPDFYEEKPNVAILLAPVASCFNDPNKFHKFIASKEPRMFVEQILETFKIYNLYPYHLLHNPTVKTLWDICGLVFGKQKCHDRFSILDPKIDCMEREDVGLSNFPAGAGYKCELHYM